MLSIIGLIAVVCLFGSAGFAQVYTAGSTYLFDQHSGSTGRMVGRDGEDYVHVVWTNALNTTRTNRHVSYNVYDPFMDDLIFDNGTQADLSTQAGAAGIAVAPDGWGFPAFDSRTLQNSPISPATAIDFLPQTGAFSAYSPNAIFDEAGQIEVICPKIARAANGNLHMVSAAVPRDPELVYELMYSRGVPIFEVGFGEDIDWQPVFGAEHYRYVGDSRTLSHVIAASPTGSRLAAAWTSAADDTPANELYLVTSEDGGLNWSIPVNLTNFIPPDTAAYCQGADVTCANRDTIRCFDQVSLLFDDDNHLHLAFTTVAYYRWSDSTETATRRRDRAILWHWDETSQGFHQIAENWTAGETGQEFRLGEGRAMVEHPALSFDAVTGYLYCSYLQYADDLPGDSILIADVFLSRSTDNGLHWSAGVNVTNTPPGIIGNENEQELSCGEYIAGGELDLFYLLHREFSYDYPAGAYTASDMIYRRVNVNAIAYGEPLPERAFHVDAPECETVGAPIVTLQTVSQDQCDSVVVTYDVMTEWGVTLVHVYRNGEAIGSTPATFGPGTWVDYEPLPDMADYYVVGESESCGLTDESITMPGAVSGFTPDSVRNVTATQNDAAYVVIRWTDLPEFYEVVQYVIRRNGLGFALPLAGTEEYYDYDARIYGPGVELEYDVTAFNECGIGPYSEPAIGMVIPPNEGRAELSLTAEGPPDWDYDLNWIEGCVNKLTIRDLCPGTVGSVAGETGWTATNYGDSVVFETAGALCEDDVSVAGFRLSNDDEDCIGEGRWTAGEAEGMIHGPLPAGHTIEIPREYLVRVYPNPFNAAATIRFDLPEAGVVDIRLFNLLGQELNRIARANYPAGIHRIHFEAGQLPSGVYLLSVSANRFTKTEKIVVMK